MDEKDIKISEMERTLEHEKKRLKEAIGAWKRKVNGQGARRTSLREGYNADTGMHYKVYVLSDLPADLAIEFVLETIKESTLPSMYPFQFRKIDYSTKYKGWLLEVERPLNVNMNVYVEEALLNKVYGAK